MDISFFEKVAKKLRKDKVEKGQVRKTSSLKAASFLLPLFTLPDLALQCFMVPEHQVG